MTDLDKAADATAREFLSGIYRTVREFDVTLARNAILDCLFSAEEPDFIRDVADHAIYGRDARRVIGRMAPHMVELAGRTATGWRAAA
ncbi:hypothetical protein [Sulfitobacter sp. S190]|uniref:hypothetical protein n=1 Tax=Sulfitobacter sp. S190 TaxID=2867022 RepID=UPI0021A3C916|nr:hypothetical protein [Sulfitobacter sp. S190]UWR21120.1 hypothetical protein K3756_10335 [Sulfitobacter sp. S190]